MPFNSAHNDAHYLVTDPSTTDEKLFYTTLDFITQTHTRKHKIHKS